MTSREELKPGSVVGRLDESQLNKLLKRLRLALDDPMWADHVELPKVFLKMAIEEIEAGRHAPFASAQTPNSAPASQDSQKNAESGPPVMATAAGAETDCDCQEWPDKCPYCGGQPALALPPQAQEASDPADELNEIADGAWGDGPRTRGAARDLLNSRATAAPLGTWSYRVTANGFYELWQETEAGPHYAGQVNSLPSAETICERLNELPPALALPPQDGDKAQNQLAGSERLGPQYDGTRSITSSPMVARHHEASDEAPCTSSPQGRKPEAAALIEAAIEAARASKTALGYDATKVQQLGRFTMANWKHIEKLWAEPPQGRAEGPNGELPLTKKQANELADMCLETVRDGILAKLSEPEVIAGLAADLLNNAQAYAPRSQEDSEETGGPDKGSIYDEAVQHERLKLVLDDAFTDCRWDVHDTTLESMTNAILSKFDVRARR